MRLHEHGPGCIKHEIHTSGPLVVAAIVFEDTASASGWSVHVDSQLPAGRATADLLRTVADAYERDHRARCS